MIKLDDPILKKAASHLVEVTLKSHLPEENSSQLIQSVIDLYGDGIAEELIRLCVILTNLGISKEKTCEDSSVARDFTQDWLEGHVIPKARELYQVLEQTSGSEKAARLTFEWAAEQYGLVDVNALGLDKSTLDEIYQRISQELGINLPAE